MEATGYRRLPMPLVAIDATGGINPHLTGSKRSPRAEMTEVGLLVGYQMGSMCPPRRDYYGAEPSVHLKTTNQDMLTQLESSCLLATQYGAPAWRVNSTDRTAGRRLALDPLTFKFKGGMPRPGRRVNC